VAVDDGLPFREVTIKAIMDFRFARDLSLAFYIMARQVA
jgi:hypothetical protein